MFETVSTNARDCLDLPMAVALVGCAGDGAELGALAAALAGRGHLVTVYVRSEGEASSEQLDEGDGYRIVEVCAGPSAALGASDALPLTAEFASYLNRAWERDPPNLVHGYGWLPGLAAQLAARRQQLPTVQTFHGFGPPAEPNRSVRTPAEAERVRLEPVLARAATWVTASCTADLNALSALRHSRARMSLVPGGVDVERFSPVGPAASRGALVRIVCVATSAAHLNDVDHVVGVMPKLADTELLVAATGHDDTASLLACTDLQRRAAGHLGLTNRLHLLGTVEPDRLPPLLRSADVVACTPRSAPRATEALQAMACGVAVVATDIGALSDVVVHDVTGLLVPVGKPADLAVALKTLQAQQFQREGMGAAGRARARSRYAWARIAVDFEAAYRKVARGMAAARPACVRPATVN